MAYASWSVSFGEQPSAAKWNIIGSNMAGFNDGSAIGASAITPEKLFTGTGTTWPLGAWTPSWTNLTIGNATVTGAYKQIGKTVFCRLRVVFGTTTATSASNAQFSLPVTAVAAMNGAFLLGSVLLTDTSAGKYCPGVISQASTTYAQLNCFKVDETYSTMNAIVDNVPFGVPWTTSDEINGWFSYESA